MRLLLSGLLALLMYLPGGVAASSEHHLLLLIEAPLEGPAQWRIQRMQVVASPLPKQRGSLAHKTFLFEVGSAQGKVLYRGALANPFWLRGEFQPALGDGAPGASIDGHHVPVDVAHFPVRIPQLEAADHVRWILRTEDGWRELGRVSVRDPAPVEVE